MTARTRRGRLAFFLAAAASFGVFWLPFLLPPAPLQAVSEANAAGFNNRVAVLAAGLLAVLATGQLMRLETTAMLPAGIESRPMSRSFVFRWPLLAGCVSGLLFAMIYRAHVRYGYDYGYFIAPITKLALDHRKLYTEVDFPYGPLLIYPPIWLRGLFAWCDRPLEAAYGAVYLVEQVGGLLSLAYTLQVLPILSSLRRAMFAGMAVFCLTPSLGMNYTFFRFATPVAIFIFCVRGRRLRVASPLLVAGQMTCLGISPEMGFSFACGTVTYSLLMAVRGRLSWVAGVLLPIASSALFLLLAGRGYRQMLELFSGGVYNLVVAPQPYVLFYLLALLWLAPVALAQAWNNALPEAVMLFGIYGMGLGLLPVAFGRADLEHVLFNAVPLLLLSLIGLSASSVLARRLWVAALAAILIVYQLGQIVGYRGEMAQLPDMRRMVTGVLTAFHSRGVLASSPGNQTRNDSPSDADIDRLQALTGGSRVCAPQGLSLPVVEEALRRRNLFQPGTYFEMRDVLDRRSEERQAAEVNQQEWALLPEAGLTYMTESPETIGSPFILPLPYHSKRTPYVSGRLLEADLQNNWHVVDRWNGYLLYRRNW